MGIVLIILILCMTSYTLLLSNKLDEIKHIILTQNLNKNETRID